MQLTFSSAFPIYVCILCEEQLQIARGIQKKFLKIDEYWRGKSISFATVILKDPAAQFEIKHEPPEYEVENVTDYVQPDVIAYNETEASSPSNCIELRIEKVKNINEIMGTSKVSEQSSSFFCYICDRSMLKKISFCFNN